MIPLKLKALLLFEYDRLTICYCNIYQVNTNNNRRPQQLFNNK